MPTTILGLDIGGANLKAATADKRAVSTPFPLWKQPDRLADALATLTAHFPDAEEFAVTMTGELCDCFATKREGVHAIIAAVRRVSDGRRIHVWSTDGAFLDSEEAKLHHAKVAASNWHALATLAGRYAPHGRAILIDIGSTTTDIIPILDGKPVPVGKTDEERLQSSELLYTGVRRTPLCAILGFNGAAELFATTLDVYLTLGMIAEDASDCDTADGRPATRAHARARLCRMYCGDVETIPEARTDLLAQWAQNEQSARIINCLTDVQLRLLSQPSHSDVGPFSVEGEQVRRRKNQKRINYVVISGIGEFLAQAVMSILRIHRNAISLGDRLDSEVSACAPAYAVAVLASQPLAPPGHALIDSPGDSLLQGLWPWSGRS
jgi:probable H4MPT-linked C1 transfer pathway protein